MKICFAYNANKDELPDTINRLTENEKTLDKLKKQINEIDEKKGECREETEETEYKRKRTKNISIAVIVCTFVTMAILITAQVALKLDMQIVYSVIWCLCHFRNIRNICSTF